MATKDKPLTAELLTQTATDVVGFVQALKASVPDLGGESVDELIAYLTAIRESGVAAGMLLRKMNGEEKP